MKFHIFTFGCQMNVCDSEWIERSLIARGWQAVPEDEARVFLINTCSVREKPEQKVYSLLGRLQKSSRNRAETCVAVGGCVAQQVGQDFWRRFPQVRLVFGPDGVASVPDSLERLLAQPDLRISLLDFEESYLEREAVPHNANASPRAFVNIMQGCDNFCAYCIVPFTRGRQKSRPSGKIVQECRNLIEAGVKEITLLGQNVNSYGLDAGGDGTGFAELLETICSLPGLRRLRFTTSHPKDLAPEVIEAFRRFPVLCPGLHLPLQSGSNRILKRMNRHYTRESYLQLIQDLRLARPDIALSTDIIVGFPGETEADFQQTLDLVQTVGFDSSFSFNYSDRPGVRAALFQDKIPEADKSRRLSLLQKEQDRLTQASLQGLVGRTLEVLVEGPSSKTLPGREPSWMGREPGGRIVNFPVPGQQDLTGALIRVKIVDAKKHSVFGEVDNT